MTNLWVMDWRVGASDWRVASIGSSLSVIDWYAMRFEANCTNSIGLWRTLDGESLRLRMDLKGEDFLHKYGVVGKNRGQNRRLGLLGGWGVSILDSPR